MFVDNLILRLALWAYKRKKGEIRLKDWLMLEGIKEKVIKAVGEGSDQFPELILEFISTALHVPAKHFRDAHWLYVVDAFYETLLKCPVVKIPLTEASHDASNPEDWDYEGRTWHRYSHMLAKEYGWTLEYISRLQVGDALTKIQEILVDEQLEKEFHYRLSELAYSYDKQAKKSYYVPLPRPSWMRPKVRVESIPRIKMPASILPVGNTNYDALPEELRPQPFVH